jgi:hypothetical protein
MPMNLLDPTTWQTSVLNTPEGPIQYWVLADWDAYFEQFEDVNNLTRVLIAVDWNLAGAFKSYALGFADRIGAATYFERYTPLTVPWAEGQFLTSLKKARIHAGAEVLSGPTGRPVYHTPDPLLDNWPALTSVNASGIPPRIVYDATFTCPVYDILNQTAFLATDQKELRRYVTREQQVTPRERKVPSAGFETYDPANPATMTAPAVVPILEVGFVPFYTTEFHYTWRKVPVDWVPGAAIGACLNRVNAAVFDILPGGGYGRFPIGTLLFKGLANKLVPYRGPNAEWLVDLPYVFDYQPGDGTGAANTWNTLPRNDGTWAPVRVRGTNPPKPLYQSADFEPLFQPGP